MSEQEQTKTDAQLSDEQLEDVSGGLSERFSDAHRENLNDAQGELSDEQLKDVAGGLSERFGDARDANINKLSDTFQDERQQTLDR
ncbi:MAG: hypothetical protein Kow00121_17920 [Elainellaceae cyanobacterium]